MTGHKSSKGSRAAEQPESLTTFEKAARSGGKKPDDQVLTATPETASRPDSSARKSETATKVLQAGVEKNPGKATDAVQKSRDPRIPR